MVDLLFTAEQSSAFTDFCGIFIAVDVALLPYIYYESGQNSIKSSKQERDYEMNPIINSIKGLHPAYFAMVMSTGIISIASKLLGFTSIAYALFYINIVAYAILLPFQTIRIFVFWENLYKDLCNPKLSLVFFTTVAATNVLGAQFITIVNQPEIAKIFWYFGIFLWVAVSLFVFSILFIKCEEGPESVIHGGWL